MKTTKRYEAQMLVRVDTSHGDMSTWVQLNSRENTIEEAQRAVQHAKSVGLDYGRPVATRIVVLEVVE